MFRTIPRGKVEEGLGGLTKNKSPEKQCSGSERSQLMVGHTAQVHTRYIQAQASLVVKSMGFGVRLLYLILSPST